MQINGHKIDRQTCNNNSIFIYEMINRVKIVCVPKSGGRAS